MGAIYVRLGWPISDWEQRLRDWQLRFWYPATEEYLPDLLSALETLAAERAELVAERASRLAAGKSCAGCGRSWDGRAYPARRLMAEFDSHDPLYSLSGHTLRHRHSHREFGGHHRAGGAHSCVRAAGGG